MLPRGLACVPDALPRDSAVQAIAFCDSPFTDLSLRSSLALILLSMWNLLFLRNA